MMLISWFREYSLDYPGGPKVIRRVLISERQECQSEKHGIPEAEITVTWSLALKMERGSRGPRNTWPPLETGKVQETQSPLQHPEIMQSCWHLDFSPMRRLLKFWSPELYQICVKPPILYQLVTEAIGTHIPFVEWSARHTHELPWRCKVSAVVVLVVMVMATTYWGLTKSQAP